MTPNPSTNHPAARVAGVVGWPMAHSLSPTLHGAWIKACRDRDPSFEGVYRAFAVRPEHAENAFRSLPDSGLVGVNVTVPYKEVALRVLNEIAQTGKAHILGRARDIGAVNLIRVTPEGHLTGDNTDAVGFIEGLYQAGADDLGPAVILGAGGAARAVAVALASRESGLPNCEDVRVVNRTLDKATEIAQLAKSCGAKTVTANTWSDAGRALEGARLLVNATSLGMHGSAPLAIPDLSLLAPDAAVYDLVYVPRETELLKAARRQGLTAIEGLDMLIGQARPSFEAFFGVTPPDSVDARALLADARPANPPADWPVAIP